MHTNVEKLRFEISGSGIDAYFRYKTVINCVCARVCVGYLSIIIFFLNNMNDSSKYSAIYF